MVVLRLATIPIFVLIIALLLQRLHFLVLLLLSGQPSRRHILAFPLLDYLMGAFIFQQILEMPETAVHIEMAGCFKVLLRTSIAIFAGQLQTRGRLIVTLLRDACVILGSGWQRGHFLIVVKIVSGIEGETVLEFVELFGFKLRLHSLHILSEFNLQGLSL